MTERKDAVDEALRALASATKEWMESEEGRADMQARAKEARQNAVVDMSPERIDARLRELSSLSRLCRELGKVG